MNVICVVQARMGSTRFPGKVLEPLGGVPIVELIARRLSQSRLIDRVIFAIPRGSDDDALFQYLRLQNREVYRGDTQDVQSRFCEISETYGPDTLVRITADCPLVDWTIVDSMIRMFHDSDADYVSNVLEASFPDGLDVEVFSAAALVRCRQIADTPEGREHVTFELRRSDEFSRLNYSYKKDLSSLRWTVDFPEDLTSMAASLPQGFERLTMRELLDADFAGSDVDAKRDEGSRLKSGQKMWNRAKKVIPGGNMFLSKRPEMFLPGEWPSYYSKAKGFHVWDLEDREFLDFALMGVGTSSLGYGDEHVDSAVKRAVDDGVMSSLNSAAEVELAEQLVALHPWADKCRLLRTGGEANAQAVRIARATTGKNRIAICGYHGWHDWYLAANLNSDTALDGHLLPGLDPAGVPVQMRGTTEAFQFNDERSLARILDDGDVAAVVMEIERNLIPTTQFLEAVRELCSKHGALLIVDECTSGFRQEFGGRHLAYGLSPDIALFGKALGNGYAITAVIGSEEAMYGAQSSFMSSTFWSERLGPVAALATLRRMDESKSWIQNTETGRRVKSSWKDILGSHGFESEVFGLDAMPGFKIESPHWTEIKTFITQHMFDQGYLATSAFYPSLSHDEASVHRYLDKFDEAIGKLARLQDLADIKTLLRGEASDVGFRRLT